MDGVSKMTLIAVLALAFFGCSRSPEREDYTAHVPMGHTVYTIARKGALLDDENFDVVLVHGFNDNREVARQLTDFLNQSEPTTYFYFEED